MVSQVEVETFIGSSFRSVWALDLLQQLLGDDRGHTKADLVETMRSSDAVVTQSLASLVAAGLVSIDADATVWVNRSDARTNELIDGTIQLYRKSPDRVRRLIISNSMPGVTAFADAFRLRKD